MTSAADLALVLWAAVSFIVLLGLPELVHGLWQRWDDR